MIPTKYSRQEAETILRRFFPRMNLYKRTRLVNLSHLDLTSESYLSAVVINCLLEEIERLFQKRLVNTTGKILSIKLSEAQAAVLYRSLIALPMESNNVYELTLRNQLVERLDLELIKSGFYLRGSIDQRMKNPKPEMLPSDYFGED